MVGLLQSLPNDKCKSLVEVWHGVNGVGHINKVTLSDQVSNGMGDHLP